MLSITQRTVGCCSPISLIDFDAACAWGPKNTRVILFVHQSITINSKQGRKIGIEERKVGDKINDDVMEKKGELIESFMKTDCMNTRKPQL